MKAQLGEVPTRRRRTTLKGGAPRLLMHHGDVTGKAYRRAYDALQAEFGPLTSFQCMEAGRCAAAWVEVQATMRALSDARNKRRLGKGRRPNEMFVLRLAKRAGLADRSYADAVQRLRDLTSKNRKPRTLADELGGGEPSKA